jgi:uncharacterized protein
MRVHFRRTDDHHALAQAGWAQLEKVKRPCLTSNLVIAEAARGISRMSGVVAAANVVKSILESDIVVLRGNIDEESDALRMMMKYSDQQIGFTDCVSFAQMRKNKISRVFGFDRHFQLVGFTLWPGSKLKD